MFYIDDKDVKSQDTHQKLCSVDMIPRVIEELKYVFEMYHLENGRFTEEGIDKFFTAPDNFIPNKELWKQDAMTSWEGIEGPELFRRYPIHAENYLVACNEYQKEPTYEGFRLWLIHLRDAQNPGGWS